MSTPQHDPSLAQALTTLRVMGIETEFGVVHADAQARQQAGAGSSILLSHLTVAAYALLDPREGERGRRVRWDYGDESPLRDARGFEMQRAAAHPSQLTDEVGDALPTRGRSPHVPDLDAPGFDDPAAAQLADAMPSVEMDAPVLAPDAAPDGDDMEILDWAVQRSVGNSVLRSGGRWYVDHAHPEYSAPEVLRAREAVVADRAGERIAQEAMARLAQAEGVPEVALYKNNTDGKGASYGTHENYLLDRDIPFEHVVRALLPFLASRQVLVGAGRVGLGPRGAAPGFQISSRADFMEAEVGLETTLNRPIVNTRDEPHADASRFRRLHVIVGDANLLEESTFLKLGTTSLLLAALEAEQSTGERILPRIELSDPVAAIRAISHDPSLRTAVELRDGTRLTALEIQSRFCEAIAERADLEDSETAEVITSWRELLDLLAQDPMLAADRVEWVAKLSLLEQYRSRHGLEWSDPRLAMIDLQFSDLREGRSLFGKLRAAGSVATLVSAQEVEDAMTSPPRSTRSYLRGRLIAEHPRAVVSAGWDVLTLRGADGGMRLRMADPRLGSLSWCERHGVDPAADPATLQRALQAAVEAPSPRSAQTDTLQP